MGFYGVRFDDSATDELAMDCEMVGVGIDGRKNALGRVTLVSLISHYSIISIAIYA